MYLIDSEIRSFYEQSSEETRLTTGLGPLEFERNKELISRFLDKDICRIADVGGGPGHYSLWLSNLGHHVTLIDPVNKHIKQAEKRSRQAKRAFRCVLGEAQQLPLESQSVDIVILHGPLYHLQDLAERLAALKEARRVLKIGGVVLGFAINYAASTLAILQSGQIHHPDLWAMCKEELTSGEHNPPYTFPGILGPAYFHKPSVLKEEFEAVGFKEICMFAVEGSIWLDKKFFDSWSCEEKKLRLLELLRLTEADKELLGLSPHIMIAAEVSYDV